MDRIWSKTLRPGEKWSGNIGRGRYIHFKALGDDANVSLLMYNMYDTSERYNMPDTLKAQFISALTHGNVMMSDNDRVMASIVQDTTGWNDTISGLVDRRRTDDVALRLVHRNALADDDSEYDYKKRDLAPMSLSRGARKRRMSAISSRPVPKLDHMQNAPTLLAYSFLPSL